MEKLPKVAIIGGGPAGLTAAIILKRNGYPVCVFESEPSQAHRTQGGSLDLHADGGQEALRRAGLLGSFRAIARHDDQGTRNIDPWTGALQTFMPDDDPQDRPEIDRGVLRNLLLSALPASVVRWDHRLTRVDDGDDGLRHLHFANGHHETADIIIGADGAWSRVRRALTPIAPEYSGITFFEGWLETPSQDQSDYVGRGTLFALGGPEAIFAQRNGMGRICVYAAVRRSLEEIESGIASRGAPELLHAAFASWAPQLRGLLAGCDGFTQRPIYQLPLDFAWPHRDGILLCGDAAHVMPPLGVGVNLAMLDASDLALAIVGSADWRQTTRAAQADICLRASKIMRDVIPGFAEWFAQPDDTGYRAASGAQQFSSSS